MHPQVTKLASQVADLRSAGNLTDHCSGVSVSVSLNHRIAWFESKEKALETLGQEGWHFVGSHPEKPGKNVVTVGKMINGVEFCFTAKGHDQETSELRQTTFEPAEAVLPFAILAILLLPGCSFVHNLKQYTWIDWTVLAVILAVIAFAIRKAIQAWRGNRETERIITKWQSPGHKPPQWITEDEY